jgi:FkbM family methyltransferase
VRFVSSQPTVFHEGALRRVRRRLGWAIRDRWPNRRVVREVQGVRLILPWSHRLPDYTKGDSPYGQNLVRLAERLAGGGQIVVVDVGANVGDSALQIAHAADAIVVCVEGDPYYLDFLRANTAGDPRFQIEHALLVPDERSASVTMRPVRLGGTTRFVTGHTEEGAPAITAAELRQQHPCTERLRLIKSDTDGYDVALIPAMARVWQDLRPVLFFEYDPAITRTAGHDPLAVWTELANLGYRHVAVWGNGGHVLGRTSIEEIAEATQLLDGPRERYAPTYWDVAVVHADDRDGIAAIEQLVPRRLTGTRT